MAGINKVLLPTDFSLQSRRLVNRVEDLRTMGVKEVLVMYSLIPGISLKKTGINIIEGMVSKLRESGFTADYEIIAGAQPIKDITDYAAQKSCDMILIASSGKGRAREFLVGSTSLGVMKHSTVPVLLKRYLVHGGEVTEATDTTFNNVLLVVDSSKTDSSYLTKVNEIMQGSIINKLRIFDSFNGRVIDSVEINQIPDLLSIIAANKNSEIQSMMKAVHGIESTLIILSREGGGSVKRLLRSDKTKKSIHSPPASLLVIPK